MDYHVIGGDLKTPPGIDCKRCGAMHAEGTPHECTRSTSTPTGRRCIEDSNDGRTNNAGTWFRERTRMSDDTTTPKALAEMTAADLTAHVDALVSKHKAQIRALKALQRALAATEAAS